MRAATTSRETAYEYSGYLSTILYKPDAAARDSLDAVVFTAEDLAQWRLEDLPWATEWQEVPVRRLAAEQGVRIEGDFRDVAAIDSLSPTDPRYWAPLSSLGTGDDRFPVDASRYPIIEVTYRCTSPNAHPTWMWTYDGGSHFGALPKTTQWRTVARCVQYFGFPPEVASLTLRLYSPTRTVESLEVASIRFRAMSPTEKEAIENSYRDLESRKPPKHFPVLDEFMPLGVYMDAESSKRLAEMLGISAGEYWELVMQDMVAHHHNCIALAHVDNLSVAEWSDLLTLARAYRIRFLARHEYPLAGPEESQRRVIETHVRPYADEPAIFARTFSGEPVDNDIQQVLRAKDRIQQADPNHPVALIARYPNSYPLYAPFFEASGTGHFVSRRPWDLGQMVSKHVPLGRAQQFWVAAAAFMYPTQTPQWSTCPQMRLMVNLAFANGARGWYTYSYHNDPVWLRGRVLRTLTGPFLTFSDLWSELMQRMKLYSAIAPLILQARPETTMDDWFIESFAIETKGEAAPGIPTIRQFHLRGPDYSLYYTVSNNVRDMVGVNYRLPNGLTVYDLTAFVRTRHWTPAPRDGHLEMFPGQAQILLVAKESDYAAWREVVARRLIQEDLQKLKLNLALAHAYRLDYAPIEKLVSKEDLGADPADLEAVHGAKDALLNLVYDATALANARSKLIEASSVVCACDGALCRLMSAGLVDRAHELGLRVIPLAREFTGLRLELNQGRAEAILDQCDDLSKRALALLAEIRQEFQDQRPPA